ncbi:MAG: ABC transporter substrate-binding protein [Rhodospirillales bacterium]|nr:ABC transporter substrate-binding protein [Rhodospirillales bacterium]
MNRFAVRMFASAAFVLAASAAAHAQQPVKFALDWALQGNHAVFTMAIDKGHFAREGLAITMDRGFGSGDTVTKVASGAYDIGYADLNTVIPFNANPANTNKITGVLLVMDQSLAAVILRKGTVANPKGIEGKKLAAPEADAGRMLFPAFARAQGIDLAKIAWQNVTPQLRETLLVQKQVDGVTGFISTSVFNIKMAGVAPSDLTVYRYNEYGVDLLGSALIVSQAYAAKNPDTVRRFIRATIAGTRDALADPKAGMAQLKKRDPLFNEAIELERFEMVRDLTMLTDNVKKNGLSAVPADRLAKSIATVAEAYGVAGKVKPEDVYTEAFLPPQAERRLVP